MSAAEKEIMMLRALVVATLTLAREMAWELRRKCYDKIHDEQLDEINRLLAIYEPMTDKPPIEAIDGGRIG